MIGFNGIGRMGRLANQMFQYASLKGIARNTGVDFCIPYYGNSHGFPTIKLYTRKGPWLCEGSSSDHKRG